MNKRFCYRSSCKVEILKGEGFYNLSTREIYCKKCASLLNKVNLVDSKRLYNGLLCIPEDTAELLKSPSNT